MNWKTTPNRYIPIWKTHPRQWRMRGVGMDYTVDPCPQCQHEVIRHFYMKERPEISFCMISNPVPCNCDYYERRDLGKSD